MVVSRRKITSTGNSNPTLQGIFKGVEFSVGAHGPELNLNTKE